MEIPDKPTISTCDDCAESILWLYSDSHGGWVALSRYPGDRRALYPHDHPVGWRERKTGVATPAYVIEARRAMAEAIDAGKRRRTEPVTR